MRKYINDCWKKEFRAFYNPQDFLPAVAEADAKRLEKNIMEEVRSGLATVRTGKNLDLKWKPLVNCLLTVRQEIFKIGMKNV